MIRKLASAALVAALATPGGAAVVDGESLRQTGEGAFVKLDPSTAFAIGANTFDADNPYAFDEVNPRRLWVYWAGSSPGDNVPVFTSHCAVAMMRCFKQRAAHL